MEFNVVFLCGLILFCANMSCLDRMRFIFFLWFKFDGILVLCLCIGTSLIKNGGYCSIFMRINVFCSNMLPRSVTCN